MNYEVYSVIFRIILLEKIISEIKLKNNYNIKANIKNIKYEVKQFPVISALEMWDNQLICYWTKWQIIKALHFLGNFQYDQIRLGFLGRSNWFVLLAQN